MSLYSINNKYLIMENMFDEMARPYLEELEAMLATDLTEEEGFDYNDFDDKLM